ncbi:MAG: DinB family protein, partial [Bacteroidota bacterium]
MDTHNRIISHLTANWQVFEATLTDVTFEESTWRPDPEHWSLIEIVCHLVDEETEDFRARVRHTLETPDQTMPQIHPQKWVAERQYQKQNFQTKLREFLEERAKSI